VGKGDLLTFVWRISSQLLNEIMPMIYKRFTEKAAEEWRQIYKVCSLLFRFRLLAVSTLFGLLFGIFRSPGPSTSRISHQEWFRKGG
jgi:hypothetical protein